MSANKEVDESIIDVKQDIPNNASENAETAESEKEIDKNIITQSHCDIEHNEHRTSPIVELETPGERVSVQPFIHSSDRDVQSTKISRTSSGASNRSTKPQREGILKSGGSKRSQDSASSHKSRFSAPSRDGSIGLSR